MRAVGARDVLEIIDAQIAEMEVHPAVGLVRGGEILVFAAIGREDVGRADIVG